MKRISVVGSSGSGKTTVARSVAQWLRVPHLELDSVYHQANWTPLPAADFQSRVATFAQQPGWVIDGNYHEQGVLDLVWRHADTVVWLDPPKSLVLWQVVYRSLLRGITGAELWNGNRERLNQLLRPDPQDNVVLWAFTRFDGMREHYTARMADPRWSHLEFWRLTTRAERRAFLARIRAA